jgi:hypothetical protein
MFRVVTGAFLLGVCCWWGVSTAWAHGHESHGAQHYSAPERVVTLEKAVPDKDPAEVVLDAGKWPDGTLVRVKMFAPAPGVLSTDFPRVEGTPLLDSTMTVESGKVRFTYLFPIRGTYHITLAQTDGDRSVSRKSVTLTIPENPQEVRNVVGLLIGLFGLGGLSGYLLTRWRVRTHAET